MALFWNRGLSSSTPEYILLSKKHIVRPTRTLHLYSANEVWLGLWSLLFINRVLVVAITNARWWTFLIKWRVGALVCWYPLDLAPRTRTRVLWPIHDQLFSQMMYWSVDFVFVTSPLHVLDVLLYMHPEIWTQWKDCFFLIKKIYQKSYYASKPQQVIYKRHYCTT